MVKNNSYLKAIPVLAAFFVMGFCDIVGIFIRLYAEEL